MRVERKPKIFEAVIIAVISVGVVLIAALAGGELATPLIFSVILACTAGWFFGVKWNDIQNGMFSGISKALIGVAIVMLVGIVVGVWMVSGIVPFLMFWGLKLLAPTWFLPVTCIVCIVTSTMAGTSFGTVGTVGLALVGIGTALGVPPAMTAGAVVSGAFFGDKMSPMSDSSNLAASIGGVNLFRHIGSMLYTTGPATIVSLIIYTLIGLGISRGNVVPGQIQAMEHALQAHFNLNPLVIIPPLLVIVMAALRVPAIPTMIFSILLSSVWSIIFQGTSIRTIMSVMMAGYTSNTGLKAVDAVLSRGGLVSMMATVAIIIVGAALGGVLDRIGVLSVLVEAGLRTVKKAFGLVVNVLVASYAVILLSGNQALSIILPAQAYRNSFQRYGIQRRVMTRTVEDAGTIGAPLVPWSSAALFVYGVLKIPAIHYAPYAFLCWITPIFSIIWSVTGVGIFRIKDSDTEEIIDADDAAFNTTT